MGWVVAAAAVTAGAGMYQSRQAGKRADRAMSAEEAWRQEELALRREQMDWAKGVYDDWRTEFDPILAELKNEALAGREPDYAAITADTTAAFDSRRQASQRNLERYGIKPGDGQWGANDRRYGIAQATAEVGGRQMARRDAQDQRFNQLSHVYGIGSNLQSAAMGQVSGAYHGAAGAMGNMAGMYGNRAQMYGQQAYDLGQGSMQNFGFLLNQAMNTETSGASTGGAETSGASTGGDFYGIPAPPNTSGTAPWRKPGE